MRLFSGQYKGRVLQAPKGLKTRPTSGRLRESLFNICQHEIPGARFLDLFAGSGAMGLEALSRGASHAVFIDNSKESIRCIQSNVRMLGVEKNVEILYGDVLELLQQLVQRRSVYDLIYADPPYGEVAEKHSFPLSLRVREFLDRHPQLLVDDGSLFIEDAVGVVVAQEQSHHLYLKNERKIGRSALYHYKVRK